MGWVSPQDMSTRQERAFHDYWPGSSVVHCTVRNSHHEMDKANRRFLSDMLLSFCRREENPKWELLWLVQCPHQRRVSPLSMTFLSAPGCQPLSIVWGWRANSKSHHQFFLCQAHWGPPRPGHFLSIGSESSLRDPGIVSEVRHELSSPLSPSHPIQIWPHSSADFSAILIDTLNCSIPLF